MIELSAEVRSSAERLDRFARLFSALGHPLRLAIVECVLKCGGASWSDIVKYLESLFGRLNPNTINFHLTKLILDGVIRKVDGEYLVVESTLNRRVFSIIAEELG